MIDYIMNYAISIVFIVFFIWLCQRIGKKFIGGTHFSSNLIYGYIIYTAVQAIGGIIIQIFRLDWVLYEVYMMLTLLFFSFFKADISKLKSLMILQLCKKHLKEYWIIYVVSFLLLAFSLLNLEGLWNGNRQDDGWYLSQISTLPKMGNVYNIHASTGYSYVPSFMRVINTFEMEAAFYSNILQIPATIFLKFTLTYFNYFLLNICVFELARQIFKDKKYSLLLTSCCVGTLIFGLTYQSLRMNELLVLTDDWQFNSAMGYGSSIVRTMGIFILILPILMNKLSKSTIIYFILACIALLSKSTQALPMIYLVSAAYTILWVWSLPNGRRRYLLLLFGGAILLFFPQVGNDFADNFDSVYKIFIENFGRTYIIAGLILLLLVTFNFFKPLIKYRSISLVVCLLLALSIKNVILLSLLIYIYSYSLDNVVIKKWNSFLLVIVGLMLLPRINTLFINFSVYDFIVERTITLYTITFVLTNVIYTAYILNKEGVTLRNTSYILLAAGCSIGIFYFVDYQKGYSLIHATMVLKNNPELVPASTIELSKRLEKLTKDVKKPINVIMPVHFNLDMKSHYPYVLLRLYANNVRNVSAVARYGQEESEQHDIAIRGYSFAEQTIVDVMDRSGVDIDTYQKDLANILRDYPVIDTFVVSNPSFKKMLIKDFGYQSVDEIKIDKEARYYILYNSKNE